MNNNGQSNNGPGKSGGNPHRGNNQNRNSQNRRRTGTGRRVAAQSTTQNAPQPARAPAPRNQPRPATTAVGPKKPSPITQNLTLSAWDMARTRTQTPDSARGQVMMLRTHQRLVASFEKERAIPDPDRSFLRVKEGFQGSVLLIHGVGTGPGDLRELANYLFEQRYIVYVVRLPDYGTAGDTISEISWESSLFHARQCCDLLSRGGDKVHVIGMGFGAALALHLASGHQVASLVLLSPALIPKATPLQRFLVRLKLHRLKFIHRYMTWNPGLIEGMDKARAQIAKLKIPVYAAQCEDDDRASPASLRLLQGKSKHANSRFQIFPTGGHAILAEHGKESLFADILRFCDDS